MSETKNALLAWKRLGESIASQSIINAQETPTEQENRKAKARKDFAFFVRYYFPHYCKNEETGEYIKPAKFHTKAAKEILNNKNIRAVYQWPRGHAKSVYMDVIVPMWLICQEKRLLNVMILVGKSEDNAATLLGDLQAELQYNARYIHDFGTKYNAGDWQDGQFVTQDDMAFFALGRGQSPRGLRHKQYRPDYIVIDDIDDDQMCRNDQRVNECAKTIKSELFGCFGAGGGRFIMVGNLIAKNSVLQKLMDTKGVSVSKVNIMDSKGVPAWPEYWKPERIAEMQQFMGYREFQKEYMNNPVTEGAVFKADWIKWKQCENWRKYDQIVAYCDPSFKGTEKSDFKAVKVWGKIKSELHCLKAFCRQCTIGELVRWFYDLHESIPQGTPIDYFIEANMLQDMILDEFTAEGERRGYQLPIRGDKRKKPDKFQRVEAVSALWERGFVWYDSRQKEDFDMQAAMDQTLAFERGMRGHDDAPDADEGAIYILQRTARSHIFEPQIGKRLPPSASY
ncbi:MAG: hypothetical protein MJZ66_02815 [Bacteroidales bacterium]|nr:hypothetical protein [Bacteroidales bacterium]